MEEETIYVPADDNNLVVDFEDQYIVVPQENDQTIVVDGRS